MGDNIKELPSDDYPITSNEKLIVERFFAPLKTDEPDTVDYKQAGLVAGGAFIIMNLPCINVIFTRFLGEEQPIKLYAAKFAISAIIFYVLIKYNIDLKSLIS